MTILAPQPSAPLADVTDDINQHPEDCATGDLVEYVRTNPDNTDLPAVLGELMRRHRCSTSDQLTPLIMGHADDDEPAITPGV